VTWARHPPPAARFTASPGAVVLGSAITFNAAAVTDLETATAELQVSWDFEGTQTTLPPWTPYASNKTATHTYTSAGLYMARMAVLDAQGNVSYAERQVAVVAQAADLCIVTDTSDTNDLGGAPTTCTGSPGPNGLLSLNEAVAITNARAGKQVITFVGPATYSGTNPSRSRLTISQDLDVIGAPGVAISSFFLDVTAGTTRVANLDFTNERQAHKAGPGTLVFQHTYLHGTKGVSVTGALQIQRSLFTGCPSTGCAQLMGGALTVVGSEFRASPKGLALTSCGAANVEVRSSVFSGNTSAIENTCGATLLARNNTFAGNGTAITLVGGTGHVLRNNIFTSNTNSAVSCGSAMFSTRDFHVLFGNASNGCLDGDPDSLTVDPLYLDAANQDFRLSFVSPARDSAAAVALDLNGAAPGNFLGDAADRGGQETW